MNSIFSLGIFSKRPLHPQIFFEDLIGSSYNHESMRDSIHDLIKRGNGAVVIFSPIQAADEKDRFIFFDWGTALQKFLVQAAVNHMDFVSSGGISFNHFFPFVSRRALIPHPIS